MCSVLFGVVSSQWRHVARLRPLVPLSRSSSSLGFKPGEHTRRLEALESLANRDLVLFSYEASGPVFWKNAVALAMFPVWSYLAKVSWGLEGRLSPHTDGVEAADKSWALSNIQRASGGVAVGFFLFGEWFSIVLIAHHYIGFFFCFLLPGCGISAYWVLRTMSTVRRLVLRKGGKHVTLITYGIFGRGSKPMTVPVSHVWHWTCSSWHSKITHLYFCSAAQSTLRFTASIASSCG